MLKITNLHAEIDGKKILNGLTLEVAAGEVHAIMGPNGAGKSTLAYVLGGRPGYEVTAGSVEFMGQDLLDLEPHERAAAGVFLGFQYPVEIPGVSNVQFLREALNSQRKARGEEPLSGGEFQRAMLARAIARKPDLLVLDEPVQGVDFTGEIGLYDLIKRIRDDLHCGVLLISHDLHVVMAATDRVICLNGHVCCSGTPTAVASSEAYHSLFGGRGSATLAVYEHHHDHTHLPDGRVRHADGTVTDHCHPDDGHHHDHDHKHGHDHGDGGKGHSHAG